MAVERDDPYWGFNFLVDLGTGDTGSVRAGFQDASGLSIEMTQAEYRNGNEKTNHVRKVDGMYKVGDVTLKRGLIGATDLYEWIDQCRRGDRAALRSVTITLQDETHETAVMVWRLTRARPMRYAGPTLSGKGGADVLLEELVVSAEDMTIE